MVCWGQWGTRGDSQVTDGDTRGCEGVRRREAGVRGGAGSRGETEAGGWGCCPRKRGKETAGSHVMGQPAKQQHQRGPCRGQETCGGRSHSRQQCCCVSVYPGVGYPDTAPEPPWSRGPFGRWSPDGAVWLRPGAQRSAEPGPATSSASPKRQWQPGLAARHVGTFGSLPLCFQGWFYLRKEVIWVQTQILTWFSFAGKWISLAPSGWPGARWFLGARRQGGASASREGGRGRARC